MVSKLTKRTPTKSIKDHRKNTLRKRTPLKSTSSSLLIATINDSLFTCRRRLVKIFSKLINIATPKPSTKKQGFQKLKKHKDLLLHRIHPKPKIAKPLFFTLPPSKTPEKFTIFLDLDETLIHSSTDPHCKNFDFVVRPVIDAEIMNFYVLKRPWVDEFLAFLSTRFEIVVFTAGLREYASLVLDVLDKNNVINHRLYRDSCREWEGNYVKDLSQMGRDLWKVVLVDDNPNSFASQRENGIQIKPFVDDLDDQELRKLSQFLEGCDGMKDMRDVVTMCSEQISFGS